MAVVLFLAITLALGLTVLRSIHQHPEATGYRSLCVMLFFLFGSIAMAMHLKVGLVLTIVLSVLSLIFLCLTYIRGSDYYRLESQISGS